MEPWHKVSSGMLVGVLLAVVGPEASACSRLACPPSAFVPRARPDATAMIPSNLPALAWGVANAQRAPMASDLRLVREGATPAVVATSLSAFNGDRAVQIVRPADPWVVGARYTLTAAALCTVAPGQPSDGGATSFVVGPPMALPTTLGTLTMGALVQGTMVVPPDSFDGTCGTSAEVASRDASLALSPEAAAWGPFLLVEFLVDGRPRGFVRQGDGATLPYRNVYDGPDLLPYVVCSRPSSAEPYGVTTGRHRFQYRAFVAGSDVALLSNEVEADITCGPLRGDGGVMPSPDAGVTADALSPASDLGASPPDAAVARSDPMGAGGGCAAAPRRARGMTGGLLAALALAAAPRRHRRRS